MQQTKEKAPCTAATVQDANTNEPTKAHDKDITSINKKQVRKFPALHYEDVVPSSEQFRWLGGVERIRSLQNLMEQAEETLRECPFCGSRTFMRGGFTYASPCVRAQCSSCGCETSIMIEGKNIGKDVYYSLEQCISHVTETWNRRVTKA